mmetsp:Transcript_14537/g.22011  ORF Transcript_14537/g.22011 Transcript_14537/m.22011 type:complete len:318 (+) Transcript_14537:174-1127(+)
MMMAEEGGGISPTGGVTNDPDDRIDNCNDDGNGKGKGSNRLVIGTGASDFVPDEEVLILPMSTKSSMEDTNDDVGDEGMESTDLMTPLVVKDESSNDFRSRRRSGEEISTTSTSTNQTPTLSNSNKNNNSNNFNNRIRQEGLLYTIVFSSLSSFMLAYHVHEKAIMTAIIPMTVLAVTSKENARLFLRLSSVGHFGLMPLLYRSNELLMKVCLHGSYFLWSLYLLEYVHGAHSKDMKNSTKDKDCSSPNLLTIWDKAGLGIMGILVVYVEVIHPLELFPQISKLEFLPLMMTSLWCAIILVGCWIHCGTIMLRLTKS